jgi:hypothetical protein
MKFSELNSLVKACRDADVAMFEMGDLKITFRGDHMISDPSWNLSLTDLKQDPTISTGSVPFDTISKEIKEFEDLENLRLSDPVAYEEMVETE